jgi:hypothetical protein
MLTRHRITNISACVAGLTLSALAGCDGNHVTATATVTAAATRPPPPPTDQELLHDFAARHPERAARLLAAPSSQVIDTHDGNYIVPHTRRDGTVEKLITQNVEWRDASVAGTLRNYPTLENQSRLYGILYAHAPTVCLQGLPPPTALRTPTATQLRAYNKQITSCVGQQPLPGPHMSRRRGVAPLIQTHVDNNGCNHQAQGLFNTASWQGKYYDTRIKWQGRRGTCQTMAVAAAMEQSIQAQLGRTVDLSEQWEYAMLKTVWKPDAGKDGGEPRDLLKPLASSDSMPFERLWLYNPSPYRISCNADNQCDTNDKGPLFRFSCVGAPDRCASETTDQAGGFIPESPGLTGYGVSDWAELGDLDDVEDLNAAVVTLHAHLGVVACFRTPWDYVNTDTYGGLGYGDDGTVGGHCNEVSDVVPASVLQWSGIDTTGSTSGIYFILKNSWDCGFGDGGYVAVDYTWLGDHLTSLYGFQPKREGLNQLPTLQITSPADGSDFVVGSGFPEAGVLFEAVADDYEDGDLGTKIVWTSDVDGTLGTGPTLRYNFLTVGTRTISATVSDLDGASAQATVKITMHAPTLSAVITAPTAAQAAQLVVGETYRFAGNAITQEFEPVPCADLHWTSSVPADGSGTGCEVTFTFASAGARVIGLIAKQAGSIDSPPAKLNVTVNPPAANAPPTVSIVAPGSSVAGNGPVHLVSSVISVDPILSYKWEVASDNPGALWTTIATTASADWTDTASFHECGGRAMQLRLTATNKHGASSTVSKVYLMWPSC